MPMNIQTVGAILGIMIGSGAVVGVGYDTYERLVNVERVVYSLSDRADTLDLANLEKLRKRRPLSMAERGLYCQYGVKLGYWGKGTGERCPFAAVPLTRTPPHKIRRSR